MSTEKQRRGNRQRLPEDALKKCPSCGQRLRNTRKPWTAIINRGEFVGYTCSECPKWDSPIRRDGQRFLAVVRDVEKKQRKRRFDSLAEAEEWVAARLAEVEAGRAYAQPSTETVQELCSRWLDGRVDVRAVTVEGYRYALKPVLRQIGGRTVTSIAPADVRALVRTLATSGGKATKAHPAGRPLSPRAIKLALTALGQAFDLAKADEVVASNPVRHESVKIPRQRKRLGRDLQHWSPDELLRFRDAADADPLAAAWRLTLCGLSRADVLGLRWSDIDLDVGTVTIAQGRVAVQGGRESIVDEPKSSQRQRTVLVEDAHPGTVALLRALSARQARDRLAAGACWQETGLVVVDELGEGLRPETYSDRFRRLCGTAGVPAIRLHSVRHSLAFWLHSLGVTPADAAAFLGHTVEVHLATYLPASGNAGAARASQAIGLARLQAVAE